MKMYAPLWKMGVREDFIKVFNSIAVRDSSFLISSG
jgi:hypothetical protein